MLGDGFPLRRGREGRAAAPGQPAGLERGEDPGRPEPARRAEPRQAAVRRVGVEVSGIHAGEDPPEQGRRGPVAATCGRGGSPAGGGPPSRRRAATASASDVRHGSAHPCACTARPSTSAAGAKSQSPRQGLGSHTASFRGEPGAPRRARSAAMPSTAPARRHGTSSQT